MVAIAAPGVFPLAPRWWISPGDLDRLLLAGADPDASPALRRRTRALARVRRLERLAKGLESAVAASRRPDSAFSSAIPVRRAEVQATRVLLLDLAARIRETDGRHPAGVILARRLLIDPDGPLFAHTPPGGLRDAVAEAIVALGDVRPHSL